jgi:hypothetical protein
MTKESAEYEKFIASLVENVKNTGRDIIDIKCRGGNVLLGGVTGQPHQVDVSFIDYSFSDPTLILIECKRWKKSVDVSVPKILDFNLNDILENPNYPNCGKAIIVTTHGFQKGTKIIAECKNIIIQIVNDDPPYGFRYENIVQEAIKGDLDLRNNVEVDHKRGGEALNE